MVALKRPFWACYVAQLLEAWSADRFVTVCVYGSCTDSGWATKPVSLVLG